MATELGVTVEFRTAVLEMINLLLRIIHRDLESTDTDRGDDTRQQDTDEADNDGDYPSEQMLWRDIAVAHRKAGDEGKVCSLAHGPSLQVSDEEAECQLNGYQTRHDRPDNAQPAPKASEEVPSQFSVSRRPTLALTIGVAR
jgi:hypothetical protein